MFRRTATVIPAPKPSPNSNLYRQEFLVANRYARQRGSFVNSVHRFYSIIRITSCSGRMIVAVRRLISSKSTICLSALYFSTLDFSKRSKEPTTVASGTEAMPIASA